MAYGRKRFTKKSYASKALGYKSARKNSLQQGKMQRASKTKRGLFRPEMRATLATVFSGEDALWIFHPNGKFGNVVKTYGGAGNMGFQKMNIQSYTAANQIARHRLCPMGVFRVNCARDWVHSLPAPFNAVALGSDGGQNDGYKTFQIYPKEWMGTVNGQKVFPITDMLADKVVKNGEATTHGFFKPVPGNKSAGDEAKNDADPLLGNFVTYPGWLPQGYGKLAAIYSRHIVDMAKLSFSLINVGPIAEDGAPMTSRQLTTGRQKPSIANADANYTTYCTNPREGLNGAGLDATGATWIGTEPGSLTGGATDTGNSFQRTYTPIMIGVGSGPKNGVFTNMPWRIHVQRIPGRIQPKYIWFCVVIAKNFQGAAENEDLSVTAGNYEYPRGIPLTIDEAALSEDTKIMLVNISENAQAATIDITIDVKHWLGVPSLQDSTHGYYTAKPGGAVTPLGVTTGAVNVYTIATSRALYPLQGLYAIPCLAPIVSQAPLGNIVLGRAQSLFNTDAPNFDAANNTPYMGCRPKDDDGDFTGYSSFFCLHTKAIFEGKFYGQRPMTLYEAPHAWGGGAEGAGTSVVVIPDEAI